MPRLSSYTRPSKGREEEDAQEQEQQRRASRGGQQSQQRRRASGGAAGRSAPEEKKKQADAGDRGKNGSASLALRQLDREKEAFEALLAENREKMQKRMKSVGSDGGQTMYRQPDGTLAPNKPPRNPYTVAARRQFADLVHYCRITGGDEEYTKNSKSYRYNIGVRYEDHVRYLESLNMEPEVDALGNWIGYDEKFELPRPEDHPWSEMLENLKTMSPSS